MKMIIILIKELKKSNERIDLAHRIDRSTSGLIIITKNFNALRSINKSFLNQEISKKYFLVVNGLWNYKAGIKKMKIKRKDNIQCKLPGDFYQFMINYCLL